MNTLVILAVFFTVVKTVVKVVIFTSGRMILMFSNDTIENVSGDIMRFIFTISSIDFSRETELFERSEIG